MAAQSYSTGINQQNGVRLFRYSDWLPRSPREKYFKNDNFLTQFCLLLSVECFGHILRKSVKSTYPINFLKVDTFYKKSNVRFTLKKICKQLTLPQEIMSPLETANQWRNRTSWHQLKWVRISREKCCSCKEHLGFLQLTVNPYSFTSTKNCKWLGQQAVDWAHPDWQYSGITCRLFQILRHQFHLILTMSLRGKLHYRKLWFLSDLLQRKNQVNQLN